METLAIIAYRQPMTRAQVEAIRGVNSDSTIRTLLNRGLIEEQGRLEQPGRPILFGTTFDFLQQFGLTSLDQLPPLQE
jgi:segregation and condensation protein B